jgi:geranylgeranyl reductase family protein
MTDALLADWQVAAAALPDRLWDVVVVGAGPAGSTAAMRLAQAGRSVCVVDRARFPRHKACGDLLIPDAIAALRRSGLYDEVRAVAHPCATTVLTSPSRIEWTMRGEYLAVKRLDLDAILARGAARQGAIVAHAKVEGLDLEGAESVVLYLQGGARIRGRIGVVATGADVTLLEALGMVERRAPSSFAVRAYVRSHKEIDAVVIAFDRAVVPGYGWIFPMQDGEYNVGVGVVYESDSARRHNVRTLFDTFMREYPAARELLAGAEEPPSIRGARLRCGLDGARPWGHGRVVAIGETIGTTFPFTGEGIGKAMESAEVAAEAIDEALDDGPDRLCAYPARIEDLLRPKYYGYQVAERWLSRPWLGDLMAWRASRSRYVREAAEGIIAETRDPRDVFSVGGFLRSFLQ